MSHRTSTAFAIDVLAVLVFVAIGRRSHDETGNVVAGALVVAAPFLIAAALGWFIARAWRDPFSIRSGALIWVSTVVIGLLLRKFVFDRGTATAFVIVATITLGMMIVGWRALAAIRTARITR